MLHEYRCDADQLASKPKKRVNPPLQKRSVLVLFHVVDYLKLENKSYSATIKKYYN